MKILEYLKGKKINVKTDVGVIVQLEIQTIEEEHHSVDLEPATRENDWYPESRDWTTLLITFTNGYKKSYDNLSSIDIVD